MKSTAIFAVILAILFSLSTALAQDGVVSESQSQQERASQDYLFQFANYADSHKEYQTAKEAYQKFGTIVSQQEAITETKQVLILRAEVIRTHLQLLKITLLSQRYLDVGSRNAQVGKIEATQAFLVTHKENIEKTKSVFEVNAESQRLEREAKAITDLVFESLSFILIGQAQGLEARTRILLEDAVRQVGDDNQSVEQGASDVRRLLTNARVAIDRATDGIVDVKAQKLGKMPDAYRDVQKEMRGVKTTLKEAADLVQQISRSLP